MASRFMKGKYHVITGTTMHRLFYIGYGCGSIDMSKSDDGLWQLIKHHIPGPHWQRIESSLTGGGIPDVNGCYFGRECWLELKSVKGGQKIGSFTPLQAGWLLKRWNAGGRVFLVVRERHDGGPRKGPPVDLVHVYTPNQIRSVLKIGLNEIPYHSFSVREGMGWSTLYQIFFSQPREQFPAYAE